MDNLLGYLAARTIHNFCMTRDLTLEMTAKLAAKDAEFLIRGENGSRFLNGKLRLDGDEGWPVVFDMKRGFEPREINSANDLLEFLRASVGEVYYCQTKMTPELKRHIEQFNDQMAVPKVVGFHEITKLTLGPNDILVCYYPAGDDIAREKAQEACKAVLLEGETDRPALLIPRGFEMKAMPLAEIKSFRDKLNELIYDKENGK